MEKIEQIAFGTPYKKIWDAYAAAADVVDVVTFGGWCYNGGKQFFDDQVGYLAFDYKTGLEREYLYYPDMMSTFHSYLYNGGDLFLSHLGAHVPSIDSIYKEVRNDVIMDVVTTSHDNEKLKELGRTYRYVILDWRQRYGYFYKLIQRIEKPISNSG